MRNLIFFFLVTIGSLQAHPKILCVVAHPDDETLFAATVYAITHHLKGTVDVVMITNGEGGYKYSTLAEPYYNLKLTREEIGRAALPSIRKQEALNGGKIMGVRHYYFFNEVDHRYTLNEKEVFQEIWNISTIENKLANLMKCHRYDAVFTMLPTQQTHGHHKAATLIALNAVLKLPEKCRPVILAAAISDEANPAQPFEELPGYPQTKMTPTKPIVFFNKRKTFGFKNQLDYQIIVNWVIAEHKSQGAMQQLMNKGDRENFYFFALNNLDRLQWIQQLFQKLGEDHYEKVSYPDSDSSHHLHFCQAHQNS
ncbi:LmbE family protein [Waddlia chondrophila 2032/99]|uniref:LmbE family protein n=1 Tax=Waddlia chondrophila 2032/99 TaxID=765953 RepID=F8LET8_9BACT|nr:LmbE family protein [Waddlia chondrophila 2032/99]